MSRKNSKVPAHVAPGVPLYTSIIVDALSKARDSYRKRLKRIETLLLALPPDKQTIAAKNMASHFSNVEKLGMLPDTDCLYEAIEYAEDGKPYRERHITDDEFRDILKSYYQNSVAEADDLENDPTDFKPTENNEQRTSSQSENRDDERVSRTDSNVRQFKPIKQRTARPRVNHQSRAAA